MRLRLILLSLLLVGGSVLAIGGLNPDLLFLIALIGGVVIVLDWANKSRQVKREELHEKPEGGAVTERHNGPSITRQGALIGGVVGVVHGLMTAIEFQLILLPVFMTTIPTMLKSNPRFAADPRFAATFPKALSLFNTILAVITVAIVPIGALIGCVAGVLFVSLREHIPGSSLVRKSLVFSLFLVVIAFVFSLRSILDPTTYATFGSQFFQVQVKTFVFIVLEYPLIGCLFGYLLNRRLKQKGVQL